MADGEATGVDGLAGGGGDALADPEAEDRVEAARVPSDIRSRLALALDVDDLIEAKRLASSLSPYFGTVKVGLELYTAAGPTSVGYFAEAGFDVFCDLKLHDIPTTVARAARVVGSLGARWMTAHTQGGRAMLGAAVEGLREGASGAGTAEPGVLAVTVLTSEETATEATLGERCDLAVETGCGGVICAAPDLAATEAWSDRLVRVVPGIRLPGGDAHDQARVADPGWALASGADLLVIGRMVTAAEDPVAAAESLVVSLLS